MRSKPNFTPQNYKLFSNNGASYVEISGQKLAPPSKRLTLDLEKIKVKSAVVIFKHKKGDIEYEVSRINRLKSFKELRVHTNSLLYPGSYVITLEYTGKLEKSRFDDLMI